jgi:hypothetical protein
VLHDPQIAQLLRQGLNHESVPDPLPYYLFGYGIPGLLALAGLPGFLRHRLVPGRSGVQAGEALLWSFAAAGLLLLFVPYHDVGHRGEGLQLAVAPLAARALVREALPRLWRRPLFARLAARRPLGYSRRRLRSLSLNLVLILSSTSVLALAFASVRAGLAISAQVYPGADDRAALDWLGAHARPADVVAADPFTAQYVAAYAGTHVVFGQQAYTPDYDRELLALSGFLRGTDPARAYLAGHGVAWLWWGPRERADSAGGLDPGGLDFLDVAFRSGDTVVYSVRSAPEAALGGPGASPRPDLRGETAVAPRTR